MAYFDKKVALVTGGAGGIGFAVVKKLLETGITGVGLVDICLEDNAKIEKELQEKYHNKIILIQADVTKDEELEGAFEKTIQKFKNLDIVINNAGIVNEVQWEKTIAVNLEAVIRGTYLAKDKYLPKYASGKEGIIVNTASILGLFGLDHLPVYCATKHGVIGFGKSLGAQRSSSSVKIKVITFCPGVVATPLLDERSIVLDKAAFKKDVLLLSKNITLPDFVGKSVIQLIEYGEHGSVWIIEDEEPPHKVKFLTKTELKNEH